METGSIICGQSPHFQKSISGRQAQRHSRHCSRANSFSSNCMHHSISSLAAESLLTQIRFLAPSRGRHSAREMAPCRLPRCVGASPNTGNPILLIGATSQWLPHPVSGLDTLKLAERVGFEPTIRLPVCRISSAVLSTAQPPLRGRRGASPARRPLCNQRGKERQEKPRAGRLPRPAGVLRGFWYPQGCDQPGASGRQVASRVARAAIEIVFWAQSPYLTRIT
jgi:hypothetical protein